MVQPPDLTKFKDALERLVVAVGTDVTFQIPNAKEWPPGTQIDADTGEPHDPTVDPIGGGDFNNVVIRATVAEPQIANSSSDVEVGPSGVRRDENPVFIIRVADFAAVEDATRVVWHGQAYRITDTQPDGMRMVMRYLIWTEAT